MLNEHLWSGIIHRSETGEERKEDDVNLLDFDGLCDYLNKQYKSKDNTELFKQESKFVYCYPCTQSTDGLKATMTFHPNLNVCSLEFFLKRYPNQKINIQQVVSFIKTDGFETSYQDVDCGYYLMSTPDNKSFIKLWDDVISVINDCNVEKVKN
jgi:hypothetical protein